MMLINIGNGKNIMICKEKDKWKIGDLNTT